MTGSSYMSRMYFQFSVQFGYRFRIKTVHDSSGTSFDRPVTFPRWQQFKKVMCRAIQVFQNSVNFLQTAGGKNIIQGMQLLFCDLVFESLVNFLQSLFVSSRATSIPPQYTICEVTQWRSGRMTK